jgi:hypothetical protein
MNLPIRMILDEFEADLRFSDTSEAVQHKDALFPQANRHL